MGEDFTLMNIPTSSDIKNFNQSSSRNSSNTKVINVVGSTPVPLCALTPFKTSFASAPLGDL